MQQRKLFVATPMYGGQCCGSYVHSLLDLTVKMMKEGLSISYFSQANESLITRARNYCVHEFLQTDCTHLLFVDADIGFCADDVISLLAWCDPKSDKDVMCGLYPKKHINWDKIALAVESGIRGEDLAYFGSDLAFRPDTNGHFSIMEPIEVPETASGFMMIQRHVFEGFAREYPELTYRSDGRERKGLKPGKILACFETHIEESGRYLSEDFNFCRMIREIGMKVWVAPWIRLNHMGHYKFPGDPRASTAPVEAAASAA
jgi:hypothetical protein